MKLTNQQLKQIIKEELDQYLKNMRKTDPGYAMTYPRQRHTDQPELDEWGDVIWKTDDWGHETGDIVMQKKPMGPEIARSRAAKMARGGMKPDHVRKLSNLLHDDPYDAQADELAGAMGVDFGGRFNQEIGDAKASKERIDTAFEEVTSSRSWSNYLHALSDNYNYNDPNSNWHKYEDEVMQLRTQAENKYKLSEEEIEKLDDRIASASNAY